ncbi:HD domain-containing protein [Limnoglobus roseus]|uniref:HD domain-containing protein n=1 Tax=Limnoglobus roseus TaxID=2598579 RepID=A0A5C1AMQ4_9BACT|nr:HD domain-containing protein [Limnoglobus roseus]QEL19393.1 HD domain-containing protein [Limnoglobus roseus]
MPATDPNAVIFEAVAFAARAHKNQIRKDKETPYVSHVFRVALTVSQVFGFHQPTLIAAAVLHDTIEDTTTDYDDLLEKFGEEVARIVVALTKDMRLPEEEREEAYRKQLVAGGWPVCVCKLADIYDNTNDGATLGAKGREKSIRRMKSYLDALRTGLTAESRPAFEIVEKRLAEAESHLAKG